jgi:hypothetical protein
VTPPAVVAFSAAEFDVDENAGTATVSLTRSGDASRATTVLLATGGGSAAPGDKYTPVSTAVVFGPGATTATVAIPIADNHVHGSDLSVGLSLSAPGAATVIGGLAAATLVIHQNDAAPVAVQSVQLQKVAAGKHKTSLAIVVQFTGALNPAAAGNLAGYSLVSAGKDKTFGTKDDKPVPLASATYNPAANTVTLIPRKPLVLSPPLQLHLIAQTLTDMLGRPLDRNHDGQPGGDFTATLGKQGITIARATGNGRLSLRDRT